MRSLFKNEDKYADIIIKYAQQFGVPAELAFAIFATESQFNSSNIRYEAHLNDSSYGVGQILYTTAKGLGYITNTNDELARKGNTSEKLLDPDTNIYYAIKFLSNLYKNDDNILDVIASYNSGTPIKINGQQSVLDNYYRVINYYTQSEWKRFVNYAEPITWTYINQPYVSRVSAYLMFYRYKFVEENEEITNKIWQDIQNNLHYSIFEKYFTVTYLIIGIAITLTGVFF